MPLPKPKPNEEQDKFVSRCMGSNVIREDFKTQKQRVAVCYSLYKQAKKVKASQGLDEEVTWDIFETDTGTFLP